MRGFFASLVLFVALLGCGGGPSVAGTYTGMQEIPDAPEHIAQSAGEVNLTLKSDGSFVFERLTLTWEGDYTVKDDEITLQLKSAIGKPATESQATTIHIEKDGRLLLQDAFTVDGKPVFLTKTATNKEPGS